MMDGGVLEQKQTTHLLIEELEERKQSVARAPSETESKQEAGDGNYIPRMNPFITANNSFRKNSNKNGLKASLLKPQQSEII